MFLKSWLNTPLPYICLIETNRDFNFLQTEQFD